jgi:hypothetical protein
MPTYLRRKPTPLRDRDSSDPARQAVEVVQRGRMILDVSATDLEAAETVLGPFHPTSWHFRSALEEARRSWDRLRAELGGATLDAALAELPLTYLVLGGTPPVVLIPIAGQTYRADRVAGTSLAPTQWRLTRLRPPLDDGPYYACRLQDGSTQCDCAEWTYQVAGTDAHALCKHLAALDALDWI